MPTAPTLCHTRSSNASGARSQAGTPVPMRPLQKRPAPAAPAPTQALRDAGALARAFGHRLTFHPSEFTKIASELPGHADQSIGELEVHSRILDEMGMLPASPHNKASARLWGGGEGARPRRMGEGRVGRCPCGMRLSGWHAVALRSPHARRRAFDGQAPTPPPNPPPIRATRSTSTWAARTATRPPPWRASPTPWRPGSAPTAGRG